jgi:hypothetical protein
MRDKPADRFMIQIELPKVKADLEAAQSLLKSAGVEVDTSYKLVCVNPKLGRYVLRGSATDEAKSKAERIKGVQLFPDVKISPAKT